MHLAIILTLEKIMINAGIFGATGYTAQALIELNLRHRHVRLSYACAKIDKAMPLAEIFPEFRNRKESQAVF